MSNVFLVVDPNKIVCFKKHTILQKEDILLLYIGYLASPNKILPTLSLYMWELSKIGLLLQVELTAADRATWVVLVPLSTRCRNIVYNQK